MDSKPKKIFSLFMTFFKIGAFTFGGGYAMIPLIQREIAENHKWITNDDILDIIAISESTPGPISVNSATFVGYKVAGVLGAAFSTFGLVLPSYIIITIVAFFLDKFSHLQAVEFAFNGIRAGVLVLIIKALISMYKQCPKNIVAYIVMALAFMGAAILDINALIVLVCCAIIGLVTYNVALRREKK